MRKVLIIAGNSLLRTSRDKKALALLLLMPMILIAILGSALQGMMGEGKINPFKVILVNADQPARPPLPPGTPAAVAAELPEFHLGKLFADEVLGGEQVRRLITTVPQQNLQVARDEVAAGRAIAAVHIPAEYTAEALAGRPGSVRVLHDPGHQLQSEIVLQIVNSFTEGVTAGVLSGKLVGADVVQGAMPVLKEVPAGTRTISAMQYYAAAMAVMFMVMTAFGQAGDIISERRNGTLARILVSPTGQGAILAGLALGTVTILLGQFLVLMAGTRLLFGVYWGPLLPALALGSAFALATTGIGLLAAGLLNDPRATDGLIGIVGTLFASLSGAMFPIYAFPAAMKLVAKAIPNYWALQGFLDQMAGLGATSAVFPVSVLAGIGLVTGLAGTLRMATR